MLKHQGLVKELNSPLPIPHPVKGDDHWFNATNCRYDASVNRYSRSLLEIRELMSRIKEWFIDRASSPIVVEDTRGKLLEQSSTIGSTWVVVSSGATGNSISLQSRYFLEPAQIFPRSFPDS